MKFLAFKLIGSALLIASGQVAMAQTSKFDSCMESASGLGAMHNTARLVCIEAEFKVQDAKLNKSYRAATSKMTQDQKSKAVLAQRAWIQLRDADCNLEVALDLPLSPSLCLLMKTERRATELEEFTP